MVITHFRVGTFELRRPYGHVALMGVRLKREKLVLSQSPGGPDPRPMLCSSVASLRGKRLGKRLWCLFCLLFPG